MQEALSNTLILDKIISRFPGNSNDLRKLRLVAKLWDEVVLSLRTPKIRLNLNPLHKVSTGPWREGEFLSTAFSYPSLYHKLARSIHVTLPANETNRPTLLRDIEHFLKYFSHSIQTLSVLGGVNAGSFMYTLLAHCDLPNLRELSITVDDYKVRTSSHVGIPLVPSAKIPAQPKLVKIRYMVAGKYRDYSSPCTAEQQKFLIDVIAAAPNLEELEIRDDYFFIPGQHLGGKLKRFRFNWMIERRSNLDLITLLNLNMFLEEVKVSLERLELGVDVRIFSRMYNFDQFRDKFHLPGGGLPNLKSFVNGTTRIFKCAIKELEKMEGLVHLDLCEVPDISYRRGSVVMNGILKRGHVWRNVTSLRICGIESPDMLGRIDPMFPSLKKLSVTVSEWMRSSYEPDNFLITVFSTFEALTRLTHLTVLAPFPLLFSSFVDFLEYLSTFPPEIRCIRLDHCAGSDDGDNTDYKVYRNLEFDPVQSRRFYKLVPALSKRNSTEFFGVIFGRQTGLEFRKDSKFVRIF